MNEVYRRKTGPRDWPMPPDIVQRQVDLTTNMLATPYCPSTVVGNEFYIPGTDPIQPCDVHTSSTLYPDTSGVYPDSTRRPANVIIPGSAGTIQPGRPLPRDTSRRFRDSAIFALPPRDTSKIKPRRDTTRPPDSLRGRPPKIPPDTIK
jgi:hypothetical protein